MILEIFQATFFLSTIVMAIYLARHFIFTISVLRRAKKTRNFKETSSKKYEPTVSILIPARDEENVIERLLQRMTELTYAQAKTQIVIIDDASSDRTGEIAEGFSKRYPFFEVLHRDKKVGGKNKASALNCGLHYSKGQIVLCFDADYLPQRDIVEKLVAAFADPKVGAVQGRPVVFNESQNLVTRIATLERIGGYRVDQEARDNLGLIPQFGGTVGGFRRELLEKLGGFDESMLAEDTDLTFQIRLSGFLVRYSGDAECYEEAVNNLKAYWRQRHRWAKGHMQVCFKQAFGVLRCKNLTVKEKIDGLLLLHLYFLPVINLFSSLIGVSLVIYDPSLIVRALWFILPLSFYSCVGNFAPFFEVGIGIYLDGRRRLQWLVPLLIFAYLFNVLICTKALLDLLAAKIFRSTPNSWSKTMHYGNGNR